MSRFKLAVLPAFALVAFLAAPEPVTAGHGGGGGGHGGGGGGHGGGGGGGHGGHGHGGYGHGGYGYGYGFGAGFYPGYGYGGYGYGGYGYGYGYYPGYDGYGVPPLVPPAPAVLDPNVLPVPGPANPTVSPTAAPKPGLSFTSTTAAGDNTARVRVLLPADAQLWLGGEATSLTGGERIFVSPAIVPGRAYSYQIKVRWTQNGRPVEQSAKVKVYANKTTTVEFRAPRVSEE